MLYEWNFCLVFILIKERIVLKKKKIFYVLGYFVIFKEKNCNECIILNYNEEVLKEFSYFNYGNKFL